MIQSTPYQVEQLDWDGRKAYVTRTHVDYYTDAIDYTKLKVLERFDGVHRRRGHLPPRRGARGAARGRLQEDPLLHAREHRLRAGEPARPGNAHHARCGGSCRKSALDARFASRQDALDGFLGAAYALHVVAKVAVMADAADLQKAVGSGDGAWFATADGRGRGQLRGHGWQRGRHRGARPLRADRVPLRQLSRRRGPERAVVAAAGMNCVVRAKELIERCDCKGGCPACVGPVLTVHEDVATSPKGLALSGAGCVRCVAGRFCSLPAKRGRVGVGASRHAAMRALARACPHPNLPPRAGEGDKRRAIGGTHDADIGEVAAAQAAGGGAVGAPRAAATLRCAIIGAACTHLHRTAAATAARACAAAWSWRWHTIARCPVA